MKGMILHIVLTATAALSSVLVMSRGEEPVFKQDDRIDMWPGPPDALTSITYESKTAQVKLEARRDALGRYFVVSLDREDSAPAASPDAGAAAKSERKHRSFISSRSAEDLVGKVAPLRAFRSVGKVENTKLPEFLLDQADATVKITIGGQQHAILVGGVATGGVERYVKNLGTGEVFAIPSELTQTVLYADNRLMEHDLHAFNLEDATRVRISKGPKSREIVRLKDRKEGWADSKTPANLDETVGNWMSKVGWFRATEYVEKPPVDFKPEDQVLRLEYFNEQKKLGSLELYKAAPDYLARTEYSRWFVKVAQVAAEQVENDLGSILK